MKPVLFVTGHAPAYRVGAFARLHELEQVELALFGGRYHHGGPDHHSELPFPHRHVRPSELYSLARSGNYRAVVCPTGGRLAPLATWIGARSARIPLILWASLWAHPRSLAHAFTYLPLRRLYRSADAVVTYGPHVSAYVQALGARRVGVAPQSVDNDFWRSQEIAAPRVRDWPLAARTRFLFVGRPAREKGLDVLLAAWHSLRLPASQSALVLAGVDASAGSVLGLGQLPPRELRDVYAACHVLVVPSIPTRTFREPWGLVVNEAMNRGLAVIATNAVGAAAGGLVRDGDNGVIVRAGDSRALAGAIERLTFDARLREQMGAAGHGDVLAYSHDAWARGFSAAFSSVGVSRGRC